MFSNIEQITVWFSHCLLCFLLYTSPWASLQCNETIKIVAIAADNDSTNKPLFSVSLENLKNLENRKSAEVAGGSRNDKFSSRPQPSSSAYNYGGGRAQLRQVTLGVYWNPVIT